MRYTTIKERLQCLRTMGLLVLQCLRRHLESIEIWDNIGNKKAVGDGGSKLSTFDETRFRRRLVFVLFPQRHDLQRGGTIV
jgi:hypothetical protein